jgi:phage repressor protein C with HTH and peptisase S24 domain
VSTLCQDARANSSMAPVKESAHGWGMGPEDIKRLLKTTGKSQAGLAKALGVDASIVHRMKEGTREIKAREVATIAKYFDQPDQSPVTPDTNVSLPVNLARNDSSARLPDVEVLGTVLGSREDEFLILDEPIEYVRRMPGIMGKAKVYALYVQGDSMSPWQESGDLIYVDPNVPPRIGDYVVVQLKKVKEGDGRQAFVKRLIGRSPSKLKLAQYQPAKEIEFPTDRVASVHRVLSTKELSGI